MPPPCFVLVSGCALQRCVSSRLPRAQLPPGAVDCRAYFQHAQVLTDGLMRNLSPSSVRFGAASAREVVEAALASANVAARCAAVDDEEAVLALLSRLRSLARR